MQYVAPVVDNPVTLDAVAKSNGNPISAGTVNFYLYRVSTGKWWVDSSSTWSDTAAIAKVGGYVDDGHWITTLKAAAWISGEKYLLYIKESGDLHIPQSEFVQCSLVPSVIMDLIEADKVIDTGATPWVLEYRHKTTKTVLLRQTMKNTAGATISSINNVLGQLELE
jgi:hypothetical protein